MKDEWTSGLRAGWSARRSVRVLCLALPLVLFAGGASAQASKGVGGTRRSAASGSKTAGKNASARANTAVPNRAVGINESLLTTEAGPAIATYLGEVRMSFTDLSIRGRGLDFALTRHYRSLILYFGPFGRNMDSPFFARLRDLPSGDVDFYPGDGTRSTFRFNAVEKRLVAPKGVFLDLYRRPDGSFFLVYPDQTRVFFDADGRMARLVDRNTTREDSSDGNAMNFFYDGAGQLAVVQDPTNRRITLSYYPDNASRGVNGAFPGLVSRVTDFDQRAVDYSYDADGRLVKVEGPDPGSSASKKPKTTLAWTPLPAGSDLKNLLYRSGELRSITDGEDRQIFQIGYEPAGTASQIAFADGTWRFAWSGSTTAITDPLGNLTTYSHDEASHAVAIVQPGGATTAYEYDDEGRLTAETRPMGGRIEYTYASAAGNSKLPMGNLIRIAESPRPGSPEATAGQARVTTIAYGPSNLPSSLTSPGGAVTTITRDGSGNPTSVKLPDNSTRTFEFDSRGLLTASTNGVGVRETYIYFDSSAGPAEGYLRSRTVNASATTTYELDARGNVTTVTDGAGRSVSYQMNKLDQVELESRSGSQTKTTYNAAGQVTARDVLAGTSSDGTPVFARTSFDVDELGRLKTRSESGGAAGSSVTSYAYDAAGNLKTISRTASPPTSFDYDSRYRVTAVTTGSATTRYSYDDDGVRTMATSPLGFATTYLIDGFGRSVGSVDPTSVKTLEVLDADGRSIETRVTKLGSTTETLYRWTARQYDPMGRVTKEIRKLFTDPIVFLPDGTIPGTGVADVVTETAYDAAGNVASTKDPLGRVTTNEYDGRGRLKKTIDPAGNTVEYEYDDSNNKARETVTELSPSGPPQVFATKFEYDAANRLKRVTDPLNQDTLYDYDSRGNRTKVTDVENHVATSEYDLLGRKTRETDANGGVTVYEYDLSGRLTALVDANGNRTEFAYDADGRLKEEKRPDLARWTYGYDAEGNRTSATDSNGTAVSTSFDPINRPTQRDITRGSNIFGPTRVSFGLDPLGRIVSSATLGDAADVVETFKYDSLDRVLREEQKIGSGPNRAVVKAYDAAGNLTGLTYPSGLALTYDLDPLNRIAAVKQSGTLVATYRDVGARPLDKTYANGITQTWSYDPGRRLTEILSQKAATTVSDVAYTLSPLGNKQTIARPDLGKKGTYQFNSNSWITQEALGIPTAGGMPELQTDYTIDKGLNYTQIQERVGGTITATKAQTVNNRNQYSTFAGAALSYDANGNLTGGTGLSGTRLAYDFENRLKKATKADGTVVENLYDAQGRKVRESATASGSTRTTDYVLHGDQVLEQYAGANPSARYVHGRGIDEAVRAELDTDGDGVLDTTVYPLQDELANVERLTDAAGATVERYDYQGYGKPRIFDAGGATRGNSAYGWKWLFQGREYQTTLGAYDFRAREIWPELGRFGQEDQSGTWDSPNRYQALLGNWLGNTDPNGLLTVVVHGTWARQRQGADPGPFVPGGDLFEEVKRDVRDYKYVSFQWSGVDTVAARTVAATGLAGRVKRYPFRPGEPLRFIGHSHGANVVALAIQMGLGRRVDDFVALSRPIRFDYPGVSPEQVINYVEVFNVLDPVQATGGSLFTFPFEHGPATRWSWATHWVRLVHFGLPGAAHAYSRRAQVFRQYIRGFLSQSALQEQAASPASEIWHE